MSQDDGYWEHNTQFKLERIKLPEREIKPGPVTIDTFTEGGKRKFKEGVSINDFTEGTDFTRKIFPYEEFPHP